jgi:hypothetical protein
MRLRPVVTYCRSAAVTAGDAAAAKAAFDKLNDLKKKGHEDFKKE